MAKKPGGALLNKMGTECEDVDQEKQKLATTMADPRTERAAAQPKLETNFTVQLNSMRSGGIQVADASTQVFTRTKNI